MNRIKTPRVPGRRRAATWTMVLGVALTASALPIRAAGPSISTVTNAASYAPTVAPGSIAAVFGTFSVGSLVTSSGTPWPTSLAGVTLQTGNGAAVPLYFAASTQLGVQVPWEVAGQSQTTITASQSGQSGAPFAAKIAPFAPGIFSMNAQGSGQGAVLDGSYRLVDASNPAAPGSVLQIYCTGLGAVSNQPPTGAPAPASPLAETTTKPTVTIGGVSAPVLFSGLTPGLVGLYQVNAQVPAGLSGGPSVPLTISIGGVTSNAVTVALVSPPVSVVPTAAFTIPGGVQSFAAAVTGVLGGGSISWSIQETAGGRIAADGTYTAPTTPGTYHVIATNRQDSSQRATATVRVLPANAYSVLNSFTSRGIGSNPDGALVQSRFAPNHFYGPTLAGVFEMDAQGNAAGLTNVASRGISPLIQASNGVFYGTATSSGPLRLGSIFSVDSDGGLVDVHILRGFNFNEEQGVAPKASLIEVSNGVFYGTTSLGGNPPSCSYREGCGTVFRVDVAGNYSVLHSFTGPEGAQPAAPLVQLNDGFFYGTTSAGGVSGLGTIFKMDKNGNVTVLRSLTSADGTVPLAGLIDGGDGYLYGTASAGGTTACKAPILNGGCGGTVFRISPSGDFSVLHVFSGADGNEPAAPLVRASDGFLYGTTWAGGNLTCGPNFSIDSYPYFRQAGCGTIFRVDATGNFAVVHAFASLDFGAPQYDGAGPVAGLIQAKDGNLYGTTFYGGTGVMFGTAFRLGLPGQ